MAEPLGFAAFHGLARKVVERLLPHSEADPAALLVHFLVAFGNAVGRGPHAQVEADRHAGNLYVAFIGETGEGRKGTAAGRIRDLFARADADWAKYCVKGGMSSGEGVIQAIRDPLEKPVKEKGQEDSYKTVVYDQGVADKRLFLREPELSRMFRAMALPGNTLSQIMRSGWDGQDLEALTKYKPVRATNPHISVAGDITVDELRKFLGRLELVNGFANRFLFVCTRRSKSLPEGGGLSEDKIDELAKQLREALDAARKIGRVERDPEARELWAKIYLELSADRPALLGAATSRAAAQVLRLSLIYALLDGSAIVRPQHLRAHDCAAVEQGIDQREPQHLGCSAAGSGAEQRGPVGGQFQVNLRPQLPGFRIALNATDLARGVQGLAQLFRQLIDLVLAQPTAFGQGLRTSGADEQKAIGEAVDQLQTTQELSKLIHRDVAGDADVRIRRPHRLVFGQRLEILAVPPAPHDLRQGVAG